MMEESNLNPDLSIPDLLTLLQNQEEIIGELRSKVEKCKNLFDKSIDGIYKSTPDGKFIDMNKALVKMLGYNSKEELLGINIKTQLYYNFEA